MFIPLGDDNSLRRNTPLILWLILGINVFVWYLQLTLGDTFTNGYAAIPFEVMNSKDLISPTNVSLGGQHINIPQAPGPSPIQLTMISAMFMHGSWEHIIGNMVYLMIFGDQIEDLMGKGRFILFYLACGVCASLAHVLTDPNSTIPSLGASGAIAGLLGAYLVNYPGNKVRVLFMRDVVMMPATIVLGGWILLQLISQVGVYAGEQSGVAYMAHIGGFAAGVPLSFLLRRSQGDSA